jgi:hypothetical protein
LGEKDSENGMAINWILIPLQVDLGNGYFFVFDDIITLIVKTATK